MPLPVKLLLAEDDRIVRIPVRDSLEEAGYAVTERADGEAALRAIAGESFDIVLTDVRLPGATGIEVFRQARRLQPGAAIVLMTAYADTSDAVAVMREGARDYVSKPFEMDELLLRLARVRQEVEFRRRMEARNAPGGTAGPRIRGEAPATRRLVEQVEAAAAADVPVLISGETGTGKDLCARMIHERSRRAGGPLVAVSCGAIPENLLESELFGHDRGAFTGADKKRTGRFETAGGGTLFLDEIGEFSLGSQAKLLRAIETSTFEPLGSSRPVHVDVRIIAATNRDLAALVEAGSFRKDLYYRLNVMDIRPPPLRERRSDVPLLVRDFLGEIAARAGCPVPALDPGAVVALATHDYPGNVRELIHALERAVALAKDGLIRLAHLPPDFAGSGGTPEAAAEVLSGGAVEPLARAVEQFEQLYVRRVLEKVGGRRGRAAELLGISRKTLWERLREPS